MAVAGIVFFIVFREPRGDEVSEVSPERKRLRGVLPFFKSKQELVEDEFEGYILTHSIPQERFSDIKEFFATYVTDKDVRRAIEDRKFQLLGTDISTYTMADLKRLGYDNMQSVVDYVADNVNVSRFM